MAYLTGHGIDRGRITLEDESLNTVENIRNSMNFLDAEDSVGIVTNNFHMFRAMRIAKKMGLEYVYAIPADSRMEYLPNNMLRELMGVTKDFLKGNL